MREYDLHRQRRQQRTVGLALAGLEKGGLFVLKKTVVFAFIKAVWFALRKADCFALRKAFCSPLERRFVRFEKSGFFRFYNGRLRVSRSVCFNSNRRVTNIGRRIPNN